MLVPGLGHAAQAQQEGWPVRLTDFEALSFDCYGTLIDWEAGIAAVLSPWASSRGLNYDEETLLTASRRHDRPGWGATPPGTSPTWPAASAALHGGAG